MALTMGQLASKVHAAAREAGRDDEKKLRTLAQAGVGHMKRAIQSVHAVDSGTMLNSTTADQSSPQSWLIGPTVDYAIYVALGTSRMAARPFHITAASALVADIEAMGFGTVKGL